MGIDPLLLHHRNWDAKRVKLLTVEIRPKWVRRGGVRRELKNRGKGMKGRVDSMGIVTFISEVLSKIKPTESLIFSKSVEHKNRN